MRRYYRNIHFWVILTIMIFGALFYYADMIPLLRDFVSRGPFQFLQYSTYRILSLTPVAYAAFAFGWKEGVTTAVIVGLALLPRALLQTVQVEAVTETIAFFFIGLLVTWVIHRQQRSMEQLEKARLELQSNVEIIRENERRLAILNRVAQTLSNTLDMETVLNHAIDNVLEVMQADAVTVYIADTERRELNLAAYRGLPEYVIADVQHFQFGEDYNGKVAETGQPLYIESGADDPRPSRSTIRASGVGSLLIVPLATNQRVNGTLCITMFRHRVFTPSETELLTTIGNQIGVALENAYLYQQQQAITQQLRLSEERYRAIFENSSDAIFACTTNGEILSMNQAGELLTGRRPEEVTGKPVYDLFSGPGRERLQLLFTQEPLDVSKGSIGEMTMPRHDGTESVVEVKTSPLLRKDEIIGVQIIAQDVTEERRLRQNMEYYITQITRAQEDERLRISRELHDDTAQVLAGLSRDLDTLINTGKGLDKAEIERLKKLHTMADAALQGVRRFAQDLRPSILDHLGLVPALEWLMADLEKNQHITTRVNITGDSERISPESELAVFRIAQEVLSNIRRHSQATMVEMSLNYTDKALELTIRDNGRGFNLPERTSDLARSGRLGIIGMTERARLIGGTLEVTSEEGKGTVIRLYVPRQNRPG